MNQIDHAGTKQPVFDTPTPPEQVSEQLEAIYDKLLDQQLTSENHTQPYVTATQELLQNTQYSRIEDIPFEIYIRLCGTVCRAQFQRFIEGKSTWQRDQPESDTSSYRKIGVPGQPYQGDLSIVCTGLIADQTTNLQESDISEEEFTIRPAKEKTIHLKLEAATEGIMQGIRASDKDLKSRRDFQGKQEETDARESGLIHQTLRYGPDNNSTYDSYFAAGYILGKMNRGELEPRDIASMQIALDQISDTRLRENLEEKILSHDVFPGKSLQKAVFLERPDSVPDMVEEYRELHEKVCSEREKAAFEKIEETIHETAYAGFLGSIKDLPDGFKVTEIKDLYQYETGFIAEVSRRKATVEMLKQLREQTRHQGESAITTNDILTALEAIVENNGVDTEFTLRELLKNGDLSENEQRVAKAAFLANQFTTPGSLYTKGETMKKLHEDQVITADDIFLAHNVSFLAVDGVNRAVLSTHPTAEAPLRYVDYIPYLAEMKEFTEGPHIYAQGSEHRVGPLAGAEIRKTEFSSHIEGERAPYYFLGTGNAKESPIPTYKINGTTIDHESLRDQITGDTIKQLEAVRSHVETVALSTFPESRFGQIKHRNSDVQDAQRLLENSTSPPVNCEMRTLAKELGWQDVWDEISVNVGIQIDVISRLIGLTERNEITPLQLAEEGLKAINNLTQIAVKGITRKRISRDGNIITMDISTSEAQGFESARRVTQPLHTLKGRAPYMDFKGLNAIAIESALASLQYSKLRGLTDNLTGLMSKFSNTESLGHIVRLRQALKEVGTHENIMDGIRRNASRAWQVKVQDNQERTQEFATTQDSLPEILQKRMRRDREFLKNRLSANT